MNLNLPLCLYYETCDEDGMVEPYFTGDITDSEGRVVCRTNSEGKALDLIGGFDDLLANIEALRARLAEVEKRLEYRIEADEQAHGLAQWWADKCKEVERQLSEANRECAEVEAQRDGLKESLEEIRSLYKGNPGGGIDWPEMGAIACEALAKLEAHDGK